MIGTAPSHADYDTVVDNWQPFAPPDRAGYSPASERTRGLVELARPVLLIRTEPRVALDVQLGDDDPLTWLGDEVAAEHGLRAPLRALVHRDVQLAYHRDTRAPYPCVNATVVLRSPGALGGLLVLPDERVALACEDGSCSVFDGQRVHGLTSLALPLEADYRLSITYYCPTEETWA